VEVDRFALKGALSFNFLNIVGYCFLLMVETRNEFLFASVRTTSSLFHDADSPIRGGRGLQAFDLALI
jgi:hypothetical protein